MNMETGIGVGMIAGSVVFLIQPGWWPVVVATGIYALVVGLRAPRGSS